MKGTIVVIFSFFLFVLSHLSDDEMNDMLKSYMSHVEEASKLFHHVDSFDEHISNKFNSHRKSFRDKHQRTAFHPFSNNNHLETESASDPWPYETDDLIKETHMMDHVKYMGRNEKEEFLMKISGEKFRFSRSIVEPYTQALSELNYDATMHKGSVNMDAYHHILSIESCNSKSVSKLKMIVNVDVVGVETVKHWISGTRFISQNCPDRKILYGKIYKRRILNSDSQSVKLELEVLELSFKQFFLNSEISARNYPGNETLVRLLKDYADSKRRYTIEKTVYLQAFNWNYNDITKKAKSVYTIYSYENGGLNVDVKCSDCYAYLNAEFWIKIQTSWGKLVHFEVGLKGAFRSRVELLAKAVYTNSWTWNKNFLDIKVMSMKFFIGPFPIMIDFGLSVDMKTSLTVDGDITAIQVITLEADASLSYMYNKEYSINSFYRKFSNNIDFKKPEINANGELHARADLDTGFHIKPYGLFDIVFIPEAYIGLDMDASLAENRVTFELYRGINLIALVPPVKVLGMTYTFGGFLPKSWTYTYQAKTVLPCTFSSCINANTMIMEESITNNPDSSDSNFNNFDPSLDSSMNSGEGGNVLPSGVMTGYLGGSGNEVQALPPPYHTLNYTAWKEWRFFNPQSGGHWMAVINCHGGSDCICQTGVYNSSAGNYTWDTEVHNVTLEDEFRMVIENETGVSKAALSVWVKDQEEFAVSFLKRIEVDEQIWGDESGLSEVHTVKRDQAIVLDVMKPVRYSDYFVLTVIHPTVNMTYNTSWQSYSFANFLIHFIIFNGSELVCETDGYYPFITKSSGYEFLIDTKKGIKSKCPVDLYQNSKDYMIDVTIRAYGGTGANRSETVDFQVSLKRIVEDIDGSIPTTHIFQNFTYKFLNNWEAKQYIVEWEDSDSIVNSYNFSYRLTSGPYTDFIDPYFFDKKVTYPWDYLFLSDKELGFNPEVGNEFLLITTDESLKLDGVDNLNVLPVVELQSGVTHPGVIGYHESIMHRKNTKVNKPPENNLRVDYDAFTVVLKRSKEKFCHMWMNVFQYCNSLQWNDFLKDHIEDEYYWKRRYETSSTCKDTQDFYVFIWHGGFENQTECEYELTIYSEFLFETNKTRSIFIDSAEYVYIRPVNENLTHVKVEIQNVSSSANRQIMSYVHYSEPNKTDCEHITFDDLLIELWEDFNAIGYTDYSSNDFQYLGLYNPSDTPLFMNATLTVLSECRVKMVFGDTHHQIEEANIVKAKYEGYSFNLSVEDCEIGHFFSNDVVYKESLIDDLLEAMIWHEENLENEEVWWEQMISCFRDTVNPFVSAQDFENVNKYINIDDEQVLRVFIPPCPKIIVEYAGQVKNMTLDHYHSFGSYPAGQVGENAFKVMGTEDKRTKFKGQENVVFFAPECPPSTEALDSECNLIDGSLGFVGLSNLVFIFWLVVFFL